MSKRARRTRRFPSLENLETRTLLAADFLRGGSFHNAADGPDVNADGTVNLTDALLTVQEIRRVRGGGNDQGSTPSSSFPDVNDDGNVTLTDALMVVERLRRPRAGGDSSGGNPDDSLPPRSPEPASIDGTGNNLDNPEWGSAGESFLRITTPEYDDGISTPAGAERASAREISNTVFSQEEVTTNDRGLTALVWQWGQFLDHDITITHTADPAEEFAIEVPLGDASFDPFATGDQTIDLTRSQYDTLTGDSVDNVRQQVNSISAFIDGSMVYGSDAETAAALREGAGGRMLVSEGDLLPIDPLTGFFEAGDERVNEQPGLTAMHTLFVREHNLQADQIAAENPDWTDDQIFEAARKIVIAEIQSITYNEFLPALLGNALPEYEGYDADVNPGISNIFATAAYRFGHSMVSTSYDLVDNDGELIDSLPLAGAFFNPSIIQTNGIDSAIKGLTEQLSQEIDTQVVDDLRNFLFGPPGAGGLDLVALNIQRGRDHGLADYNQSRVDLGLPAVESFADITSDVELQTKLAAVYETVDDIDVWVGVLAEDHLPGSSMGELGTAVMVDQFQRLRVGDRYYYENTFSDREIEQIERTQLSDIIERNTELTDLDRNVFVQRDAIVDDGIPHDHPGHSPRPGNDGPRGEQPGGPRDGNRDPGGPAPTDRDLAGQQPREGRDRAGAGDRERRTNDTADDEALPLDELDPLATDLVFAELG